MLRHQFMIRFGYFGQFFHGLQPQSNVPTAGGALRDLLTQAADQKPKALCFAARTDKGVHALHNIATCWFPSPFDTKAFIEKMHAIKVPGLRNIEVSEVGPKTHARGSARGKHYRYTLNGPDSETSWRIVPELDLEAMQQALSYVQGTHDFQSFRASGCTAGSSVKTLNVTLCLSPRPTSRGLGWIPGQARDDREVQEIHIDLKGDAFLRQMIRILVGVLVEIGTGLRRPEEMQKILEALDRRAAGITAPPQGLILVEVYFVKD